MNGGCDIHARTRAAAWGVQRKAKSGNPPIAFGSRPPYQGVKKTSSTAAAAVLWDVLRVVHEERFADGVVVEREVHDEPARVHVAGLAHRVGPYLALEV